MTEVIVLTAAEMEKVRGCSPLREGHEIDPVPLKDGRFTLGPEVLEDPAHEDVRDFLMSLPREPLEKMPLYTEADIEQPEAIEVARLTSRVGRLDAKGGRISPVEKTKPTTRGR